jgi:CubicO group peptidase (beta-lactamase class C family)
MGHLIKLTSAMLSAMLLAGCGSDSDSNRPPVEPPVEPPIEQPLPEYDFSAVDSRFQQFLNENEVFDGISYTLVDRDMGAIHEAAQGDHTLDIVVMLASTSKVPSVSLLMALNDDDNLDYDVQAPIEQYLPWDGVYGDRTTEQLVSNTSGIPGLGALGDYGAHICQLLSTGTLLGCAETLYTVELEGTQPAGSVFDYGGTQWQLSGAVAETVSGSSWRQAWDEYIAGPCDLEVFQYGNMWTVLGKWTGNPDSLLGLDNPQVEGGAITNMQDYGKLLLMHLNGGVCGDNRVMDEESVSFMQIDRGGEHGSPYGMGWWIQTPEDGSAPTVFYDPGLFGAISWIDIERGIGGYVAIDDYSNTASGDPINLVLSEIIDLVAAEVDRAREEAGL